MTNEWLKVLEHTVIRGLYYKHFGNDNLWLDLKECGVSEEGRLNELMMALDDNVTSLVLLPIKTNIFVMDIDSVIYRILHIYKMRVAVRRVSDGVVISISVHTVLIPIPAVRFATAINDQTRNALESIINASKVDYLLDYDGNRLYLGNMFVGDMSLAEELILCNDTN